MGLLRSEIAALEVLALKAAGELSLSALARAIDTTPSAVQRGLDILASSNVVERIGRRSLFRLAKVEIARHVFDLVVSETPLEQAVKVGARANPAIEFVSRGESTLTVVFSAQSTSVQQSMGATYLGFLGQKANLTICELDHDDVRKELLVNSELRDRIMQSEILHGDIDQSFPDRSSHGLSQGVPLHHPATSLQLPPQSFFRRLARKYSLDALSLFGSAVRSDFRLDSDVDVLIRYRPGTRLTLKSLIELERDLERAMDRDVDIVREDLLSPDFAAGISREAVALL